MRIWHFGAQPSPKQIDGVNHVVWLVANAQAKLGHSVVLMVDKRLEPEAVAVAQRGVSRIAQTQNITLTYLPKNRWRYDPKILAENLQQNPPDIVHLHSVFITEHATLAQTLVKHKIPYLVTPHGGLNFWRSRFKKILFSWLLEKQKFANAAAITALSPKEQVEIQNFTPNYSGILTWTFNPIDSIPFEGSNWQGKLDPKKLVYLGRFDVLHKGIDILFEIAKQLPDVEFHLYGTEEAKTKTWLQQLQQNLIPNVYFHPPVYGQEKVQVLTEASLYIQTSRWEGFPMSIAEALCLGVPCTIPETLNMADIFREQDIGLLLPLNPQEAAICLRQVLNQPQQLLHWSKQSQKFAQTQLQPEAVASTYLHLYQEILNR